MIRRFPLILVCVCMMALIMTDTAISGIEDAYEPDDTPGLASLIENGIPQPYPHSLHNNADVDFVYFPGDGDSSIRLETSGPADSDTFLVLLDSDGSTWIAQDDDTGSGSYSLITRNCSNERLPEGTYYARVSGINEIDEYHISFVATACQYTEFLYLPVANKP